MALFQTSVLKNYLKHQDEKVVKKAYSKYVSYFQNTTIQENIRKNNEEQFQATFLNELFVSILGYTLNPNPDFNLTTEFKNQKNNRKADGAILQAETALAVIELKGTNTKDLESIRRQAFDYKANQKGCAYVITSNFEKLRFYINDATEFEEFNLFDLTAERFELFYLCLHKDNLLTNVPLSIKESSLVEEEKITKRFYADYSLFKRELYRDLVKRNAKTLKNLRSDELHQISIGAIAASEFVRLEKNVKLTLFKKSQKLIDRFLFVFFAEDRGLLPPNFTVRILEDWRKLENMDTDIPLYERFKLYFNFLDKGRKGDVGKAEIYAYNGGLFKPDTILDTLEIDNELLYKHALQLANYDFESQVDVNILGHIFENSLNEIESVNAEIEGADFDKQKSKRKKDGVFYTPKYITKYIVENTVGKLCEEKKTALGFKEEEYFKGRAKRPKTKILELVQLLDDYRDWLLELTICDPACGSGAFLNQTLDFLIKEHQYLDELKAKILGGGIVFSDIENTILENNIYGVDLNEESVEIAKLSLWLRTAQPRRKLNDLSSNIKCGNSLIDDKKVAGSKAFSWEREFPKVFTEKDKKAFHITTAIHDSRTSQRMIDYKVRQKRAMGTKPFAQPQYLTAEDERVITETVAEIVTADKLSIMAYNICKDHMHLLLVCGAEEVSPIMQKIKSMTAKMANRTITTRGHDPLAHSNTTTMGHDPLAKSSNPTMGHDPLASSTDIVKNTPLWTQKFGRKEITSEQQLSNTYDYIRHNRSKHELPEHPSKVKALIESFCTDQKTAFATEFTGGFDVVIGNPPYGIFLSKEEEKYYKANYPLTSYKINLYILFIERMFQIFDKGIVHFIIPKSLLFNTYFEDIRKYLLSKSKIHEIFMIAEKIFPDAEVGGSLILKYEIVNQNNLDNKLRLISADSYFDYEGQNALVNDIEQNFFLNVPNSEISPIAKGAGRIVKKLNLMQPIKKFYKLKNGLNPGNIKHILISDLKLSDKFKPIIWGKEFNQYSKNWGGQFINYDNDIIKTITLYDIKSKEGMKKQNRIDFALRTPDLFETPKILVRKTGDRFIATKDLDNFYFDTLVHGIYKTNDDYSLNYLLTILNSKSATFLYRLLHDIKGKVFAKISLDKLGAFPLPQSSNIEKKNLELLGSTMLELKPAFDTITTKFTHFFQSSYALQKLTRKLQNWHELDFGDFIKELNKAKKKRATAPTMGHDPLTITRDPLNSSHDPLTKKEEFQWLDLFEENKKKAQDLQVQINQTEQKIDQMVYELYGLTEEEIALVENA